jgi:hypothetical protein
MPDEKAKPDQGRSLRRVLAQNPLAAGKRRFSSGRMPSADFDWHPKKESHMNGIWIFIGILVVWVILQAYVLPRMGIST